MKGKAVIFDLFQTLGDYPIRITDEQVSEILVSRGYPVYPQTWRHSFSFVVFIDYPRNGYSSYESLLKQVFNRLEIEIDTDTLNMVAKLFRDSPFELYPESTDAVRQAKNMGYKTAICTTTPKPFFIDEIKPITGYIDFICTGYEARCEKSNPHIYDTILEKLQVDPHEAIVIGDDPRYDIQNPKQLGLQTIQLIREGNQSSVADDTTSNVYEAVMKLE